MSRIEELSDNLLPQKNPLGQYSSAEQDTMRAFRILCHAEIEHFIEDLATSLGDILALEIKNSKIGNPFSRSFAGSTLKTLTHKISENHGLKEENLKKLFFPFGITEEDFESIDSKFFSQMNSFGKNRGIVAHKASYRITATLNPITEKNNVKEILSYLSKFDVLIQRKRLFGIL